MECYFPIDKIEKGASIAIWGYGEIAKCLIEWNNRFKYCNIVCVFEQNEGMNVQDGIRISKIEEWQQFYFEELIITMTYNLTEIKNILLERGLPLNSCIFLAEGNYISYGHQISYSQAGEDILMVGHY